MHSAPITSHSPNCDSISRAAITVALMSISGERMKVRIIIMNTINAYLAGSGYTAVYFILILCAGVNYLLELAINLVFSPALERLVRLLSKKVGRRR